MATKRTNDVVLIFNGGDPFSKLSRVADDFDVKPYENARDKAKLNRSLLANSRGAENVAIELVQVMTTLRDFTKNHLDTLGQVCLLGRSNGCALALAVAAELNDAGIDDLVFVGLSDVPMWDAGRDPKVAKVSDFRVLNSPIAAGAVTPSGGIGGFLSITPAQSVTPSVKLEREIKAKNKVNLFQILGNQMKYATSIKRWIWWSDFSEGEVHGELTGATFENRLRKSSGGFFGSPLKFHIDLNTGEHWKAMCKEAETAFATFPREALTP